MSAIQFNLLPDVKLHYVKTERSRNLVVSLAILIGGISLVIFLLLLFAVNIIQKKQLSDAGGKAAATVNKIKAIPDINKILTIQNQLLSLTTLHKDKHVTSRLFKYLPQVTPTNVDISSISLDFSANTMTITGIADSQHSVNTFVDTLKFTTYKVTNEDKAQSAFPSVIESSFSITTNNSSYSLSVSFDPQLFSNSTSAAPKLTVPKLTTTRSVSEDPSSPLFNTKPQGGQ